MAQEYFLLSNFGVRYLMKDYTNSETVPNSATVDDEITSVISCDLGTFTKENTKYRTLNSNGWQSVAPLGNSSEDGTFECIREGTGGVYVGEAGDTTYQRMKDWFMKATSGAGKASPKCIIEIVPRGDSELEGTCYFVIPNQWAPGTKDTETGQVYSFSVTPFGPQIPIKVTHNTEDSESWTFEKAVENTQVMSNPNARPVATTKDSE